MTTQFQKRSQRRTLVPIGIQGDNLKEISLTLSMLLMFLLFSCKKDETSVDGQANPNLPTEPTILLADTTHSGEYSVRWTRSAKAISYSLQEDQDPNFLNASLVYSGIDTILLQRNKPNGSVFYYRVKANNNEGSSNWSQTKSIVVSLRLPNPPTLIAPDTSRGGIFLLRWTRSLNSTSFTLQEDTNAAFTYISVVYSGPDTMFTIQKQLSQRYYYRVRGSNALGNSEWSSVRSVLVDASPSNVVFPTSDVSYSQHVQVLFNQTCTAVGCHSSSESGDRLKLDSYENLRFGVRGVPVVIPGNAASSMLVLRIQGTVGQRMPLGLNPLNQNQVNGISTWINEGAQRN